MLNSIAVLGPEIFVGLMARSKNGSLAGTRTAG